MKFMDKLGGNCEGSCPQEVVSRTKTEWLKGELSAIRGFADKNRVAQERVVRDKGFRGQIWRSTRESCPRQVVSRTKTEWPKRELSAIRGLADKNGVAQGRVVRDKWSRGQIRSGSR